MKSSFLVVLTAAAMFDLPVTVHAQKVPQVGYVFPPGGMAGTTVDVHLAGYDWTPDMEYFVHDSRVKLLIGGSPGPILIPPPPYWFGAKGRIVAMPLPREVPAKLILPAELPPGPICWQAANVNGCTATGVFVVGTGTEVVEDERGKGLRPLPGLPVTVSGRIGKIEEVDRYRFTSPRAGPITCEVMARQLGAKFLPVIKVCDDKGTLVADVAGTNGSDPSLTFVAKAGAGYVVSIHDVDFGGDRSYVYRLTVTPGPRVVAARPSAGRRGETREVEFIGMGVASGQAKLESVKRRVTFPKSGVPSFSYHLETPYGIAPAFPLLLDELPESIASPRRDSRSSKLSLPAAVTGVLDEPDATDTYSCMWKKGEVWSLAVQAQRIGSPLDVALAILGPDGKELARNDDLPETTDAGLEFTVPADGTYQIVVSDMAGKSGSQRAVYRLVVRRPPEDFHLQFAVQRVSVPLGGTFSLSVKATRTGGFKGPISLSVRGLPPGVTVPANLVIPADKTDLAIPLQAGKDAVPAAGLVTVGGTATIASTSRTRTAMARTVTSLSPRSPEENQVPALLVASTMKPRFKGQPVDQDTGRKVHRGSTHPAEVIVERLDGFNGEIVLQMAARQSYQVQGITGGDVVVPPGVGRTIYPCFMPEWLETTRTSRMGIIAVAKVLDAKGRTRYLSNDITGFVTMTMEGSLLVLSAEDQEVTAPAGRPFDVRLKVSRLAKLAEPVRLELRLPEEMAGKLSAEAMVIPVKKEEAVLRITPVAGLVGMQSFKIRATAMQEGKYPVISEASVTVEFVTAAKVSSASRESLSSSHPISHRARFR
jgi:hypothetical protein